MMLSPTFGDFILAAQRAKHDDYLIVQNGNLITSGSGRFQHDISSKELNRRTWQAFSSAVRAEFSDQRLSHVCSRYQFDWEQMVGSDFPLHRKYIEYFGVIAASAYSYNLVNCMDEGAQRDLSSCSVREIRKYVAMSTKNKYLESGGYPPNLNIRCRS